MPKLLQSISMSMQQQAAWYIELRRFIM